MARGFLNISSNFAGEANFVIVEWIKSTAQGTPVIGHVTGTGLGAQNDTDQTEIFYTSPHSNQQLQVTELPEVWFLVRFWRSSDGIAKDLLLLELAGNARTGALYPIERFEYVVDRGYNNTTPVVTEGIWSDPVQDDTGLRDTRLEDQNYWVQERGTGDLLTAEITDRSDVGGGFDFVEVGKVMNSGAVYIVYVITRIELAGDDSGIPGGGSSGIFLLTADADYSPLTMGGKTIVVAGVGPIITLTFANLAILADSSFRAQTHGGTQRNFIIQLDAGDTVNFRRENVNDIKLGEAEEIEIEIVDNIMYVIDHHTGHDKLGTVANSYKQLLNALLGDGELRVLADYPRVEELLDSLAPASVVNETTWQTSAVQADGQTAYPNKGKWMREGANFRTPDLREMILKGIDDGAIAGRYEHQELMSHKHFMSADLDNGGTPYLSNNHSTGGNLGYQFNGSSSTPHRYDTGLTGSTNQKVNSIGLYSQIFI